MLLLYAETCLRVRCRLGQVSSPTREATSLVGSTLHVLLLERWCTMEACRQGLQLLIDRILCRLSLAVKGRPLGQRDFRSQTTVEQFSRSPSPRALFKTSCMLGSTTVRVHCKCLCYFTLLL